MTSYPENIIKKLRLDQRFGRDEERLKDHLERFDGIFRGTLSAREQQILEMRFKEGLSYAQIATLLDRSRSRISQLTERALEKIRRKYISQNSFPGCAPDEVSTMPMIKRTGPRMTAEELEEALGDLAHKQIDTLDISVRSLNALTRHGLVTILDLVEMIEERPTSLILIRNIGRHSALEIVDMMRKIGLDDWADLAMPSSRRGTYITMYPENLLTRIGEKSVRRFYKDDSLSNDQLEGLEYAISTLPADEQRVIRMYYQEYLTFDEIMNTTNLSSEEINCLIQNAVGELRSPSKARYYIRGYNAIKTIERALSGQYHIKRPAGEMTDEMLKETLGELASAHIEDLGFDFRTLNCLTRHGRMETVFDLIVLLQNDPQAFFRIHNLGKKCAGVVFEWMCRAGLGDWIPDKLQL